MKSVTRMAIHCFLIVCLVTFIGCKGKGGGVDTTKPVGEIKAEAAKMNVAQLQATAGKYQKALESNLKEVQGVMEKLKAVPVTKMLGEEAKGLKGDIDDLSKAAGALRERLQVYVDQLKAKGADISAFK